MKLVILLRLNPFCESTASANRWRTLIEGLSNLGVEIELLITGGYNNPQEYSQLGRKGTYNAIKYQYLSFLFHHNIWLRRINTYVLNIAVRHWVRILTKKKIKDNQHAIIWTDSSFDSFKLVVFLKQKYPGLITFLELSEFMDIHRMNKGNALQRMEADKRKLFFEDTAFYSYTGLALMTKTLFNHYQSFPKPGPALLHLPMTVDLKRFNAEVPILEAFEKPYIAFVGVMDDAKDGVNILIEAFNLIKSEYPDLKLYLIGGWNYDTPSHQSLVKNYKLEHKVFLYGGYPRDLIPAIIKHANLLALPRPDSKQAQGGFPTKLGEYLASGNPVCVTKVGEIPDYLTDEENAFLAEPGSIDSFADAMLRALTNKEKANEVGKNGRKVAAHFFNMDIQSKILYDFLVNNISS